jgi:phosphoglycolate phosphatase-like HAD superfamily hydrolase
MILFDLDGTLVDTAHDLGLALNIQLARYGKPPLSHDEIWYALCLILQTCIWYNLVMF